MGTNRWLWEALQSWVGAPRLASQEGQPTEKKMQTLWGEQLLSLALGSQLCLSSWQHQLQQTLISGFI